MGNGVGSENIICVIFSDYDKRNVFDIEKYLQRKDEVKLNESMVVEILDE